MAYLTIDPSDISVSKNLSDRLPEGATGVAILASAGALDSCI